MKIITPDCEYCQDIERYKENLKHLKPGSRVLIKRSDPAGISEALIGNWELNLVSIPIEPYNTPTDVMQFVTDDCRPHAIVNCTDSDIVFEFRDGGELSPETDHAIFYTSGTTSAPKGVVQTREGMKHNAITVAQLHGFGPDSVHLTALPLYHCNAAAMSLFGNYFTGGTAVFLKKFTPAGYFGNIERYKAQTSNLVPTQVADLVAAGLPWPSSLRYVLTAATALSQEICRAFYELYGPKLRQGYGLSELVNFSFTMPLLDTDDFKTQMVDQYPPVGIAIPGTQFRIVDGEVQLKQPSIMRCYWNNPRATAETITQDGYLRTGDRGEIRDGFLVLTGRFKEIIIRGGENYSPVMLEDQYRRSGITGDFAVISCKDSRLGETFALQVEEYQRINITGILAPACVRFSSVARTATRKPQRSKMSQGLVARSDIVDEYENTLAAAGRIAERIVQLTPYTPQQQYLFDKAEQLVCFSSASGEPYSAVSPFFHAIEDNLTAFWSGAIAGHQVFNGLWGDAWKKLMCEVPMGRFPELADDFCKANGLYDRQIVELGAGTGNFTRLIPEKTSYLRTDINQKFLSNEFGFREEVLDINLPYHETAEVIIAVNAMHCATNKKYALRHAWNALTPGGILLLAEGMNPNSDAVWALDLLFGFIDGWWDQGGFIDRYEWMDMVCELAPAEMGYSVVRAGNRDFGGLVWAVKEL